MLSRACLYSQRHLSASDCTLSAAGFNKLLRASCPDILQYLDLSNNNLDLLVVTALSTSSWCKRLAMLNLEGNMLGEEGVRALGLGRWRNLEVCDLSHCGIGSYEAVTCLARVHSPTLTELRLNGNLWQEL